MNIEKRNKIEAGIKELIDGRLSRVGSLPLIKEGLYTCHQTITADGILTISQQTLEEVSMDAVFAYCFDYYNEFSNVNSDIKGILISTLDNRRSFWQQKIKTPFFLPNVQIFLCQYHLIEENEYFMFFSSIGNEELVSANTKLLGSDTLGEVKVNSLSFKPVYEDNILKHIKCTHVMLVVPPAVPSFVINKIAAAHSLILTDQTAYIKKHNERLI